MAIYPFYNSLRNEVSKMNKGNFGLWFNKFIPLDDKTYKPTSNNNQNLYVEYCAEKSKSIIKDSQKLLEQKHLNQINFIEAMRSLGYVEFVVHAKLISPLITGIGETHPNEVGISFDHTMGIPYISASSIKGLVRIAATLNEIFDEQGRIKENFTEEVIDDKNFEDLCNIFGYSEKNNSSRGMVIFLDSYPTKTPNLKVDIINPHYGPYYTDPEGKTPPADYHKPVPIKFLVVEPGTEFVFRALISKDASGYMEKIKKAYDKALTVEGVGAKTSIGYGIFDKLTYDEPEEMKKIQNEQKKEKERKIEEEKRLKMGEELKKMSPLINYALK
ncbi:MAG: type III-B CRISPR module RAMP protein Cmr6 [Calditerrivibrio sp.]|nr:type III-B CRISPR module RAMP protein Cmr6 [Calditerrivibrio sp.]MCA1980401.1 type III-B CRISPR module RAMP protein Cmr6 [Calditerrivibrio sp.]